jgi:hypothetical protein
MHSCTASVHADGNVQVSDTTMLGIELLPVPKSVLIIISR